MTNATSPRKKIMWILVTGGFLAIGGYFLRPLYGISKNLATPAWALYSAAICCAVYAVLLWLVDVRGLRAWARSFAPAGVNPLLAYILPDIAYGLLVMLGVKWYWDVPGEGLIGIIRSLLFAFAVVTATGALTRLGIRLHL
jgi:predicted acyltransferase